MNPAWGTAIQRIGLLRVQDTHELFSAVETFSRMRPLHGGKLTTVDSGAAPAALALDKLWLRNDRLAVLSEETHDALRQTLPVGVKIANPLDPRDDTSNEHYQQAVNILLSSQSYNVLLVIHSPSTTAPGTENVLTLIDAPKHHPCGKCVIVLTNWYGGFSSQGVRYLFSGASLPTYHTPESAITAFMRMMEYRRDQKQLRETPVLPDSLTANTSEACALLQQAVDDGATTLDAHEANPVLQTYGIHTLPARIAADSVEAMHIAEQIGYLVMLKLHSPDIPHKPEAQGVVLYLRTVTEVQQAVDAVIDRVRLTWSQARIHGLLVRSMVNRTSTQELRVVVKYDPVFDPLTILGEDGAEWRAEDQTTVALSPLNINLVRYLVIQAIRNKRIHGRSALRPLDIAGLSQPLVQVSNLVIDCPEIQRLDIHPLLASGNESMVLDVALSLTPFDGNNESRLAIYPYPHQQEG